MVPLSGTEKVPGETYPRRSPAAINGLVAQPYPSTHPAYEVPHYVARTHSNAKCMGARTLLATHRESKLVSEVLKEWE